MNTRLNPKSFLKSPVFKAAVSFLVIFSFLSSSIIDARQLTDHSIITPEQLAQKQNNQQWAGWDKIETAGIKSEDVEDPLFSRAISKTAGVPLNILEDPVFPKDPVEAVLTMNDTLGRLSSAVVNIETGRGLVEEGLPGDMMDMADRVTAASERMYGDVKSMLSDVDSMKVRINANYEALNRGGMQAQELNVKSDDMVAQVSAMRSSMAGMKDQMRAGRDIMTDMVVQFQDVGGNSKEVIDNYDKFHQHIKTVSSRFEGLTKDLERQDLADPQGFADVRAYLGNLQKYVMSQKPFVNGQTRFTDDVRKYLQNAAAYADRVLQDFENIDANLAQSEEFFRSAKVKASTEDRGISIDEVEDVCAGAEKEGLKELQECSKSCRTVCRWKEDVAGTDCYECPSGSPDSCYDVGAWPSNHPWCQPGGVCYDDPMMVCAPFGATGPNLEKLQCTNCKKRTDMCWQKVADNTTTYSICKQNCWDGKCVYKGKYQEKEWDGKDENIHCFECKTPPPPPNCEDLKWGYDFKSDCENICPAPGVCEEETMPPGAKPKGAPPNPNDPNAPKGPQDGPTDGPADDGDTQTGGTDTPSTGGGGKPANPPTGTPQQPTGGGGSIVGGSTSGSVVGEPIDAGKTDELAQPPKDPGSTTVHQPSQPNPAGQPKPPDNPLEPPTNSEIDFYNKWLTETKKRIQSREDIIVDPKEGDYTRDEANRQLQSMTKEKEYLEGRIKEETDEEFEKQRQADEAKQRQENWDKTRPRAVDYGEEMRRKSREWHLNKLKEATDALKSKLEEARDVLTARRERIQKIETEIAQLESEVKYMAEAAKDGRLDKDFAETQTRERQKRLKDLKDMRNQFIKKLREAERQYDEELNALKTEYERRVWAVDTNARRKAETARMDEYFEKLSELHRSEQSREVRRETFESMIKNLEGALAEAKANGDGDKVEEFERQIENIKRSHAEWDATLERQIEGKKRELRDLEIRNSMDGVGPGSPESLVKKFDEYEKIFKDRIADADRMIGDLEKLGRSRTPEQDQQLKALKAQAEGLRSAAEGIDVRRQDLAEGNPLSAEERQRIHDTTTRVAAGAMNTDADKSFLQLAGESLVEEAVHNMNPLVMAKKSIAFGLGIAQGVGSAVVGIVDLGVEGVDTLLEATAVNLGFEDGGIFGTDNLDTINSMITGVGSNMNFDGVIKAVVAAGGAIDAKIKELERSGDIDWATANFGGKVAGEFVVGEAAIAGALGKAGTVLRGVDKASDAVRVGDKVLDAATTASKLDEIADAERALSKLDDVPTTIPKDAPSARGPPVDRGATTVRDPNLAGTVDDAPTVREPFNPGVADDAPTQAGGFRPDQDDLKTAVGGFKPGSVADDMPTNVGGKLDDVATKIDNIDPIPPPPSTIKPTPATVIGENRALGYVDDAGKPVTLETGKQLGKGSTSTVYADATNPNRAIRVTDIGGEVAQAPQLDKVGRETVQRVQDSLGKNSPIRIVEQDSITRVRDPNSPLNNKVVEVVEKMDQGSAKKVLEGQGGAMSQGQAKAFNDATKALNDKGYAWLDNHTGNYTFEPMPGGGSDDWRVVVIDPGGIAPMKGLSPEKARAVQGMINAPEAGFTDFWGKVKNSPGEFKDAVLGERWGEIIGKHGDDIDIGAMGLDDVEDLKFNPGGSLNHPEIQSAWKP